jgi:enterochelin esterase-like enzyme
MNCAPALEVLLAKGTPTPEAIGEFIDANGPFPLFDQTRATFLFRGAADAVYWQHWIFGLPTSQEFLRVEGTDLWHLTVDLRKNSRIEYKLLVDYGDNRVLVRDPLNPLRAQDPYGANSVCATEGYARPEWTMPSPDVRAGRMDTFGIYSDAFGGPKLIQVYRPNRFRKTRRYPLLVVHDGTDYQRFSAFKIVLDNLIHAMEIPPMIVAFSDSPDRMTEYTNDERHCKHIAEELVPAVEARYPIDQRKASRCVMGASFGGVASLATAWRYPSVFGKLLLQSGSFAFTDIGDHDRGPAFDPVVVFMNAFRKAPGMPAEQVYMSCGIYESLIYENRAMALLLQDCGVNVRFDRARDGHNWENWRDRLREGLSWLFPGPLWMVYE